MGSDASIFIFDDKAYIQEAVPAFYELLRTGIIPEWLQPVTHLRRIEIEKLPQADLLKYCTFLSEDFSWDGAYWEEVQDKMYFYDLPWEQRACASTDCHERNHCPFHQREAEQNYNLVRLFEATVAIKCLGQEQFLGRSRTPIWYAELLQQHSVTKDHPLRKLLGFLGKRGFLFGHTWSSGAEGINGWLDANETIELAWYLNHLPLPKYEASFEAMQAFRKPHPIPELYQKFGIRTYECPGFSFEELSLSFVRTVADIASQEGKGILWGNDVWNADFYLNYEKYL